MGIGCGSWAFVMFHLWELDGRSKFLCMFYSSMLFGVPGKKWACSTACHSHTDTAYCASVVGQKAYSMCRSGSLKLPGFPCFESVVQDLKNSANEVAMPDFQVCVAVPNGLAIKQNLVDYWSGIDTFQLQVADLVEAHNKKYNPHGIKRGASDAAPSGGSSDWDMCVCFYFLFGGIVGVKGCFQH